MTTKLTTAMEQTICAGIRAGLKTDVDIARYARISPDTLREWKKKAATDNRCRQLVAAMEIAHAEYKVFLLVNMQRAGVDDWRMWREKLAMSDPENYGKEQKINAEMRGPIPIVMTWGDNDAGDGDAAEAA